MPNHSWRLRLPSITEPEIHHLSTISMPASLPFWSFLYLAPLDIGLQSCIMATGPSSPWSDLPPELLGLVLKKLPSLDDRDRVRGVCRSWHKNAQLQSLPPPLPWLSLQDGTFLSFPGGEIHRMPLPDDARYHGSVDNWLFLVHNDGRCLLMNPFSKTTLQLPKLLTIWHHEMGNPEGYPVFFKFAVASSLDMSPNPLLAAFITDGFPRTGLCICQPPVTTDILRKNDSRDHIYDVVFFKGDLYVLIPWKLVVLEIVEKQKGEPKIPSIKCTGDIIYCFPDDPYGHGYFCQYLVESAGRLLLVIRRVSVSLPGPQRDALLLSRTASFEVFEVEPPAGCCGLPGPQRNALRRISSLAGQALFIGTNSKSLPAGECGLPQEDCIYFTCDYDRKYGAHPNPLRDTGVFNMRNEMTTPLFPETTVVRPVAQGCLTWFFPSEAM